MGDRPSWRQDDDEEEDVDENNYKTQKDAILIAIDVSKSMLMPPPPSDSKKADRDSPVAAALKCACNLMEQRIISSPKDMMGILLFGTEKSKFNNEDGDRAGGTGYPHCYLFTNLDIPAAEDVRALKDLAEGEDEENILVPSKGEGVIISNVLFCANQIFTTKAANFGSRRLFIITDKDDPHADDKQAKSAAAVRAKDLFDLGVTVELFPIIRGDGRFDIGKFYDDIIYRDAAIESNMNAIGASKSGDGLTLLNSLIANINSRQTAKRALFSGVPFEIAPGLTISVKGYNILHRQKEQRSCYIWTDGEVPQIATGETTRISEDSARTVEKAEIKKAYKFGGEFVYFTPEEQKSLKDFGTPVIRIIGFKPRSSLPVWASIKKATFIFPSEEHYVGSTRVFSSLWNKLLKDGKMGIAWAITRTNAKPALVAIVPSQPKSDESCTSFLPSGLWLYHLPFVDDLRSPPEMPDTVPASDDLTEKIQDIVGNLKLPNQMFDPSKYPNPQLQWHYRILQVMALQEAVPDLEKAEDNTVPKYKQIVKRVGADIREWMKMVDDESQVAEQKSAKREAEEADLKPRKKVKTELQSSNGMSDAQVKKMSSDGSLGTLKVTELKDLCAGRGLPLIGRKVALVQRLDEWADQNT